MDGLRAILFDFGGTLDSDGVTWPQRFFPLYRDAGVVQSFDAFLKAFYLSDDALTKRHRLAGLDLEKTVALQAAGVLESLAPGRTDLAQAVARRFTADCRRYLTRNRPLLERLKRDYRLAVVSNFYGNMPDVLKGEGFGDLFDAVADSGAVGVVKPDPLLFHHALKALGVTAAEALMVGDSLPRDIRGAEALGIRHAWLDLSDAPACCPKGARLRSLLELEGLLAASARAN
ncbi:MAG: HAD family hydrolase [Elusimicrobia bacterium]|nr:HAD family hydrolase [Elusimicrobiota bacterium]